MRFYVAVILAKLTKRLIRLLGGGATTAPGRVAELICPSIFNSLIRKCQEVAFVSGTNGKTTTTRLIAGMVEGARGNVTCNRAGSNLMRGLVSTLLEGGELENTAAILEVDERTLPPALDWSKPAKEYLLQTTNIKAVVLLNLFRDQLDRYGEIDGIAARWKDSFIRSISPNTVIIANADDPLISHLAKSLANKNRIVFFGIEESPVVLNAVPISADAANCPECGNPLEFSQVYFSHLGKYFCLACKFTRPTPSIYTKSLDLWGQAGLSADISTPLGNIWINTKLTGMHNIYNILAATATAQALGISLGTIKIAVDNVVPAFGRSGAIEVNGKRVFISLVKNPTGFDVSLQTAFQNMKYKVILIAINNQVNDGRDVSWLWDVNLDPLRGQADRIWLSGSRADDMALRLKYSGVSGERIIEKNLHKALLGALRDTPFEDRLCVFSTYSALLELNKSLSRITASKRFWEY